MNNTYKERLLYWLPKVFSLYVDIHTHTVTICGGIETMNLKESKEEYVDGFKGTNCKGEI